MAARVTQIYAKPSVPPVIVITEVGQLISSNSLNCGMEITKSTNKPTVKIFSHNGETVEVEDTSKKDHGKNYLFLRNKKTKKVSIFGTRTIFFKKPDCYKMKKRENLNLALNKSENFNEVFGTIKSLRISKSKISDQNIVSENIFDNVKISSDMSQSLVLASNEFAKYLPMGCNRFSNNIETVYPISSLLLDNEIDLMTDFAKEILNMLPLSNDNEEFSDFFKVNINRLTHKTIQNICLLTFADGLVELLKIKPTNLKFKNKEIYPYSEVINDKLLDNFLEYNVFGGDLTSKMKDKAICHIIIIIVIINMNVIDFNWVSPFLHPHCQKRMLLLKRVIGITQLKEDRTKYTLKLPLPLLPSLTKLSKRNKLIV